MQFSIKHIADVIGGELVGSEERFLTNVQFLGNARPSELTFAINKNDFRAIETEGFCNAGAIVVPESYNGPREPVIKVNNMQLAVARAIELFNPKSSPQPSISSQADIHPSAQLGEDVYIEPFVRIGARTRIGDRAVIRSGVLIGDDVVIGNDAEFLDRVIIISGTKIGNRVSIQPGTLIGGDGFGYVQDKVELVKIPHIGKVVIEDDVSIGAYNTIERANLGQTILHQGAKTGNLVYLAHNVSIGRHTRVGGHAGIAGNTYIGSRTLIGPQAGIDQELVIGDDVIVGPKAAIIANIPNGGRAYGTPGMSRVAWLRSSSLLPKLFSMKKEIVRLSEKIEALESRLDQPIEET